jgi:hypothetical protein
MPIHGHRIARQYGNIRLPKLEGRAPKFVRPSQMVTALGITIDVNAMRSDNQRVHFFACQLRKIFPNNPESQVFEALPRPSRSRIEKWLDHDKGSIEDGTQT